MVFLKLLLSVTVIFVVAVTSRNSEHCKIASPYGNIPLDKVTPMLYNIDFNMKNHSIILGESNIFLTVYHTIRRINLHTCELKIDVDSIVLTPVKIKIYAWNIRHKSYQYVYCQMAQVIELTFKDDIDPGIYSLHIKFELSVADNKGLISYDKNLW